MELTSDSDPSHQDHAPCWLIHAEDPAMAATCVACLAMLLEGDAIPFVKKKAALERFLQVLRSSSVELQTILRGDLRVANHIALLLLGRPAMVLM